MGSFEKTRKLFTNYLTNTVLAERRSLFAYAYQRGDSKIGLTIRPKSRRGTDRHYTINIIYVLPSFYKNATVDSKTRIKSSVKNEQK